MAKLLLLITTIVAFLAFPAFSENNVKIIPEYKELLLKVGAPLDLNCSVMASAGSISLQWTQPLVDGKESSDGVTKVMSECKSGSTCIVESRLQIRNFSLVNAGQYKCSLIKNNTVSDEKVILVTAVTENKAGPTFSEDLSSATLFCNISFGSNRSITDVTWIKSVYKNNVLGEVPVLDLKDSRFTPVVENSSLVISSPKRDDAGLYIARFKFSDIPHPYDCEVEFQAGPFVQKFDKDKNLIEGDKMDLQCIVKGYPHSVVTWYKGNELLNLSGDGGHKVLESLEGVRKIHLIINSVEFSDAGEYTCAAHSDLFNETSEQSLTVRVKDKLAALWPFLGIVGEVVVLCTIIFIYEKRRNKQVQLEEKAAEEADALATDKKEGLRHRNTNPTA